MSRWSTQPGGDDHHLANRKLLVMGLAHYAALGAVAGAREDAEAIGTLLVERGRFREPVVVRASEQKLLRMQARVRSFLEALGDRDAAVVFFAGHGLLDGQGRLRLMPTDGEEPQHGLLVDDLVGWGRGAGLLVLILDCCHAGAAVKPSLPEREDGSFAIIAACHEHDSASSMDGRGILTRAVTDAIEHGATRITEVFERAADACDAAGQAAVWAVTRRHARFDLVQPQDDPIRAWRAHVREMHSTVVSFFDGRTVLETRDVIGLDVRPEALTEHGSDIDGIHHPSAMTLKALLSGRRDDGRAPRWVVLGDPGAGKSTLMCHLAWSLCTEELSDERTPSAEAPLDRPVPIFCSLARLIGDRKHPFAFAEAELDQVSERPTGLGARLRELAESKDGPPIWLLLDGFDEISRDDAHRAIKALKGWHAKLPRVTIAISSRSAGWARGIDDIFQRAAVRPLTPEQQRQLLMRWLDAPRALAAYERVAASGRLSELAANPLMLTLLAILHLADQKLPPSRTELYGLILDVLLCRGHCEQPSNGVKSVHDARAILGALSLELTHLGGETWAPPILSTALSRARDEQPDVDRVLRQVWGANPDVFFADVAKNSGIIAPYDERTGRWRYLHRSLRERLSAEALVMRGPKRVLEYIRDVARDPDALGQWAETLGLTVSLLQSPMEAFRELAALDPNVALRMLPEIDAVSAAEALALVGGVTSNNVDALARVLRGRPDASEVLYDAIAPDLDLDQLGRLLNVFDRLSLPFDRIRFFSACGRWPGTGPLPMAPDMAEIPAGRFGMGHLGARQVLLTQPFQMGRTPVTVAEYRQFDPSHTCPGGPEHPVTGVSWWRARLYAAWVGFVLPTEAQWERACRASALTGHWSGEGEDDLARVGWYVGNSDNQAHPVGQKPANPFGLCDMHGNVWEWCNDWFDTYPPGLAEDPSGPSTGSDRVLRGGAFWNHATVCRSALRAANPPERHHHSLGFRLARRRAAPNTDAQTAHASGGLA